MKRQMEKGTKNGEEESNEELQVENCDYDPLLEQ